LACLKHTGSLAGAYTAYQAAFKQAGVIEVPDLASLFDVAWALSCQSLPEGNRVAIFTNAGGPAALASDSLAANGFTLANFGEEKQKQLAEKLNPSAQVSNPVDMLGGAEPEEFSHCLSTLLDDPGVDAFLPILVPQALVDPGDVARAIVENANKTQKTVLACMVGEKSLDEARMVLHQNKVPMTIFPEVPGQVLGAMARYKSWKDKLKSEAFSFSDIYRSEVARAFSWIDKAALGEADTRPILDAYGMALIPGGFAEDFEQAAAIAGEIGYPVALKVVSEQILHKSDMGGIALNIDSDSALKNAIEAMKEKITAGAKDAMIDGYLVEKMAPKGLEVIVGMRRDPTFGPLMMFGLGGVYVELFKDVGFGVAPLSPEYAKEMIFSTKAGRLLQGFRGGPVYDLGAVVEVIGRLSQLSLDFPQVSEIEINPLLVLPEGEGGIVLDARIIMADN